MRNQSLESRFVAPLAVLVFVLSTIVFAQWASPPQPSPRPIAARGTLADDEISTIELFQQTSPSVVYITTSSLRRDHFHLDLFKIPQGTGSGFVWNHQGYIVTNYHVIRDADQIDVSLSDQSQWPAKLVGVAQDKDLAVLKIEAPPSRLKPILLGTSGDLKVGQKVFAIGNPFGLDHTLTTGVISGLGRQIESITRRPIWGVIQTDAAINPGNSGGPLLDSAGRLIGVNTAIYSPSGAYAGVGFAVPVDTINRFVPQLISYGKTKRAGLGATLADDSLLRQMGKSGALILEVSPKSKGADRLRGVSRTPQGEILLGDIIVGADGKVVKNCTDLFRILDSKSVGESIELRLERDLEQFSTQIELIDLAE